MWADVSNYSKQLTDQGCADLRAAGIVGCIVQAITGIDGFSYTRQQLDACQRNGLRIAGYVWVFPNALRASMQSRLQMFDSFPIESLWADVEQKGLKTADVDRDLALCDVYIGKLTGVYSGRWFFQQQGWLGHTAWSNRALWDSRYDNVPETQTGFIPYGGWSECTIKQYAGSSSIGSVHQIDLNVTG